MTDRLPLIDPADWTDGQRAVVSSDARVVLVHGGFRSGKTTALAARAIQTAHSVDSGEAVVFVANTAAGVEARRAGLKAAGVSESVVVTTVPELAARVLRMRNENVWTLTNPDADRLRVGRILEAMGYKELSDEPYDVWRELRLQAVGERDASIPASFPLRDEELAEVREKYEATLERTRTLDRPHLVRRAVDLLVRAGESPIKPMHVLVDDAENLSPAEVHFLRLLQSNSVTIAVNPDACVMASLGADPSAVSEWMPTGSDHEHIQLEAPTWVTPILDVARRLFETESSGGTGSNGCRGDARSEAPVQMFSAPSASAEQDRIVGAIQERIDAQDGGAEDIAVLAPTRSLRDQVVRTLRESGLNVEVTGVPWYGQETILDVLSYLFVLANPHDDTHLFRIINRPSRGIGRKTQARLRRYAEANDLSAWEAIDQVRSDGALSSRARRILGAFREMMEPLVQHARDVPPSDAARAVLADTELLTPVTRGHTREQIEREEKVERFIQHLPDAGAADALTEFLDHVGLGYLPKDRPPAIQVAPIRDVRDMTRPSVFVFGLEEGHLPVSHAARREACLAEERRRFAVAISRAESRAVLSWAQSRGTGRHEEPTSRSRFWDDIGSIPVYRSASNPSVSDDPNDFHASLRAKQASSTPSTRPTDEDAAAIQVGRRVKHPKLGTGTVKEVKDDGDQHIATVAFDDRGTKTLNLRYAPLTRLDV